MGDRLKNWISQRANQYLALGVMTLFGLAVAFPQDNSHPEEPTALEADTVIPAGYVLVPIELMNFEALSSLVGSYAVVDLFAPSSDPTQKSKKIGSDLRLLRAPLNPSQFAVLVPEHQSDVIVSQTTPLVAVIQNRSKIQKTKLVEGAKMKRSRIETISEGEK